MFLVLLWRSVVFAIPDGIVSLPVHHEKQYRHEPLEDKTNGVFFD